MLHHPPPANTVKVRFPYLKGCAPSTEYQISQTKENDDARPSTLSGLGGEPRIRRQEALGLASMPAERRRNMSLMPTLKTAAREPRKAVDVARELGPIFGDRAKVTSDEDKYVADNFA